MFKCSVPMEVWQELLYFYYEGGWNNKKGETVSQYIIQMQTEQLIAQFKDERADYSMHGKRAAVCAFKIRRRL